MINLMTCNSSSLTLFSMFTCLFIYIFIISDVKIIYDSVIRSLFEAQNRKFIAVESSFFSRWYNEQSPTIRNRVHWLVRTGQCHLNE